MSDDPSPNTTARGRRSLAVSDVELPSLDATNTSSGVLSRQWLRKPACGKKVSVLLPARHVFSMILR